MKGSLSSFNFFIAVIILIPSSILLYLFSGEIGAVCDMKSNIVLYTVVTSCMVLLSLMTVIREILTFE